MGKYTCLKSTILKTFILRSSVIKQWFVQRKHLLLVIVLTSLLSEHVVYGQQSIFLNQIGYSCESPKVFFTNYEASAFNVTNLETGTVVLSGELILDKENDPNTGFNLWKGDFTPVKTAGRYMITVQSPLNSGIQSYEFRIADGVFSDMLSLAHQSLYLQRCGCDIPEKYAGDYKRRICHTEPSVYHDRCEQTGSKDMSGGWHDAGDFGKYVAPGSVNIGILLTAYTIAPELFRSDATHIAESGNGLPDLLDEVKYELDWLLKMQRSDGAVHEKIHTKDYVAFIMPSEGKVPQFIYEVSSTATADFTAIMAFASRMYRAYDQEFSKRCLDASVQSYNYLQAHPDIFPEGGFKNPSDTKAGGYSDARDIDERMWASLELYVATLDAHYLNHCTELRSELTNDFPITSWQNPLALGYFSLLLMESTEENRELKNVVKVELTRYNDKLVRIASNNGFDLAMESNDFVWGSNGDVLFRAMNLLVGDVVMDRIDYRGVALSHLNYILGVNPIQISYVTGVGANRIQHLHHAPSVADLVSEPIPGILTGGPNKFRNDGALKQAFTGDEPPATIYIDNVQSYASNENTIYTNSALVFVASLLNTWM